jgi:spore maturation protein CgeB
MEARGHQVLALTPRTRNRVGISPREDVSSGRPGQKGSYGSVDELHDRFARTVTTADAVVVWSSLRDGIDVGTWVNNMAEGVTVFLDTDTPRTLGELEEDRCRYLTRELMTRYDVYLSSAGGPALRRLQELGSVAPRAFHCMVHSPREIFDGGDGRWTLGYLADDSGSLPEGLEPLLLEAARRAPDLGMLVAGCANGSCDWPSNVEQLGEIALADRVPYLHRQRSTLDLGPGARTNGNGASRAPSGWSPRPGLFLAAACGVPVISEGWEGLCYFFEDGREIFVANDADDVLRIIRDTDASEAQRVGARARLRILGKHTVEHRARELEQHLSDARVLRAPMDRPRGSSVSTH